MGKRERVPAHAIFVQGSRLWGWKFYHFSNGRSRDVRSRSGQDVLQRNHGGGSCAAGATHPRYLDHLECSHYLIHPGPDTLPEQGHVPCALHRGTPLVVVREASEASAGYTQQSRWRLGGESLDSSQRASCLFPFLLVPVRASPVPRVVRGSFVVFF